MTCTVITIGVSSVYLTIDYFKLYKNKLKETEELKRLQIESEVRILSNQVNPHFLFNSLNTLIAIIPHDANKAVHFTECFSKVYRYALKNKDKETVALREELDLVNDYCYLLKIRFGTNFRYEVSIPKQYEEAIVPPFTLQLLVENATKHNSIGDHEPLHLYVFVEDEFLVVRNNINAKINDHEGTGTGLENISKRLKYLTGKSIKIEKDARQFSVFIPVVFAEEYESDHHCRRKAGRAAVKGLGIQFLSFH
jgi:LytS/YehU family sensor histidine kinase